MLGIERNARGVDPGEAGARKEGDRRVEALGPGAEAALTPVPWRGQVAVPGAGRLPGAMTPSARRVERQGPGPHASGKYGTSPDPWKPERKRWRPDGDGEKVKREKERDRETQIEQDGGKQTEKEAPRERGIFENEMARERGGEMQRGEETHVSTQSSFLLKSKPT